MAASNAFNLSSLFISSSKCRTSQFSVFQSANKCSFQCFNHSINCFKCQQIVSAQPQDFCCSLTDSHMCARQQGFADTAENGAYSEQNRILAKGRIIRWAGRPAGLHLQYSMPQTACQMKQKNPVPWWLHRFLFLHIDFKKVLRSSDVYLFSDFSITYALRKCLYNI